MNTRPASTSSARPVKINLWLDLALFSAMMTALTPALTGLAVHEWLSIALAVAVVIHLLLHWQWLVNVVRRFFGRLAGGARLNLVLNVALFVDFTLVVFTGLMISRAALPVMGITLTGGQAWRGLHSLSANLILLIIALHVGIHWKWILGAGRRFLVEPVRNLTPKPQPAPALAVVKQEVR
jgi:hypothetical protein